MRRVQVLAVLLLGWVSWLHWSPYAAAAFWALVPIGLFLNASARKKEKEFNRALTQLSQATVEHLGEIEKRLDRL